MKLKNLKINKDNAISLAIYGCILAVSITGVSVYNSYERITQQDKIEINDANLILNSDGTRSYYFEAREHKITVSRNDIYYHKIDSVEGYEIESVEVNGWRDNNKVTYVNKVPVLVTATEEKNGELIFNSFGTVVNEKELKKEMN